MLIAGRAAQGLGGGGIFILRNIRVSDLFSVRCVSGKMCRRHSEG